MFDMYTHDNAIACMHVRPWSKRPEKRRRQKEKADIRCFSVRTRSTTLSLGTLDDDDDEDDRSQSSNAAAEFMYTVKTPLNHPIAGQNLVSSFNP